MSTAAITMFPGVYSVNENKLLKPNKSYLFTMKDPNKRSNRIRLYFYQNGENTKKEIYADTACLHIDFASFPSFEKIYIEIESEYSLVEADEGEA